MSSTTALTEFDALLNQTPAAEAKPTAPDLDALLQEPPGAAAGPVEETTELKGKARLNRENQELLLTVTRLQRVVKILVAAAGALAFIVVGLIFYNRGTKAREFRRAFETLHYREKRTLQANAIVLNEYSEGLKKIQAEVSGLPIITEQERGIRTNAMGATVGQAVTLADGFIKMIKDNDRERGKGSTFEYRDPFLKRPIDFDSDLGGEISLDKLRDEVRAAAKMDEAMKELRAVMLSPVPIADQMKVEAQRQDAPIVGEKGQDIPRQPQGPAGLQLPGQPGPLRLPGVGQPAPGGPQR